MYGFILSGTYPGGNNIHCCYMDSGLGATLWENKIWKDVKNKWTGRSGYHMSLGGKSFIGIKQW